MKTVKFSDSVENVEKFSKLDSYPEEELVPMKPVVSPMKVSPAKTVPGSMLNAIEDEEEEIPIRQSPIKPKKVESVKK